MGATGRTAEGGSDGRATSSASPRVRPAKTPNTRAGPEIPSRSPAINGPATAPALSAKVDTELAAVNSAVVSARLGRIAAWVGRMKVKLTEYATAATMTSTKGASVTSAAATMPIAPAWTR